MTREEALIKVKGCLTDYFSSEDYDEVEDIIKALEQQPCEDCISREEAIRIAEQGQIQGFEWQFKKLCNLPPVTPLEQTDTLDRIITQIEQVRDKDKLAEYPYNRCIRIIEEHRIGNSPVSVPAPKRKAAIERQVITTWYTPEEKLPEEDIGVLATVTARAKNREFIRAILTVFYCKSEGWYELDYGFSELTVHAWCDLEPYEGE